MARWLVTSADDRSEVLTLSPDVASAPEVEMGGVGPSVARRVRRSAKYWEVAPSRASNRAILPTR